MTETGSTVRDEWAEAWRQESDAEVAAWTEKHGEALLAVVEAAQELADNESERVVGRRLRDALARLHSQASDEGEASDG